MKTGYLDMIKIYDFDIENTQIGVETIINTVNHVILLYLNILYSFVSIKIGKMTSETKDENILIS